MIKPPVKTTDALEKPPVAKPLPSRWIPEDDPKPRANTSLNRPFDTRTDTFQQRLLD